MVKSFSNKIWTNRRVLVTGHTGFKGVWLSHILQSIGAETVGYSLPLDDSNALFASSSGLEKITSFFGDIRDFSQLRKIVVQFQPEVIFHLAAQPLVLDAYNDPVGTYATNVIGTANLFEAARELKHCRAIINVTTDKCYENNEWEWGYRENDRLGGADPYSSSKACSEILTQSFRRSYFEKLGIGVATARAGNVIGGGDWAKNRIVPDVINAFHNKATLILRNPEATRPWQHVLEPLHGYLKLAEELCVNPLKYSGPWNFGPDDDGFKTVKWLVDAMSASLGFKIECQIDDNLHKKHEAQLLKLDNSKALSSLGWRPKWPAETCVQKTVEWYLSHLRGSQPTELINNQIHEFFGP